MPVPLHDTRFKKFFWFFSKNFQKKIFFQRQQPNFCIPMTRSSVLCGTGSGRQGPGRIPRTPINENGAWIDASQAGKFFEKFLKNFSKFFRSMEAIQIKLRKCVLVLYFELCHFQIPHSLRCLHLLKQKVLIWWREIIVNLKLKILKIKKILLRWKSFCWFGMFFS